MIRLSGARLRHAARRTFFVRFAQEKITLRAETISHRFRRMLFI
jgi:hypothetical protein